MPLRYAYNTNGAAHHRLDDALMLIAEAGYDGVALTLDWHHFDPLAPDFEQRAAALDRRLKELGLGLVIETGARFMLDPRLKHEPTLISPDPAGRARRIEFLKRAVELCALCGGEAVSFWSGARDPRVSHDQAWRWLAEGVREIAWAAHYVHGIDVAFEPEPGMLVDTLDDWARLDKKLEEPGFQLALDLGHCLVTGERDPAEAVHEFAGRLGTVSIEDMRRGEHVHLPFGRGDMDVPSTLRALRDIDFRRLVCVELSRESHRAHEAIPEALRFLREQEAAL